MINGLSNLLSLIADAFSGASNSACILWHWDPVECPKEIQ